MPAFFQWVYPLLPFRYGMKAMHAAIAGAYGNEYWVALGQFMLFMIPALLIGLIVARPLVKSDVLMEQLVKTGVRRIGFSLVSSLHGRIEIFSGRPLRLKTSKRGK